MSIATVVTRGYGTGSYADVNKLPTLGYSVPVVVYGPIIFAAGQIYRPGAQQGDIYRPGFQAGDIYRPGAMQAEVSQ